MKQRVNRESKVNKRKEKRECTRPQSHSKCIWLKWKKQWNIYMDFIWLKTTSLLTRGGAKIKGIFLYESLKSKCIWIELKEKENKSSRRRKKKSSCTELLWAEDECDLYHRYSYSIEWVFRFYFLFFYLVL